MSGCTILGRSGGIVCAAAVDVAAVRANVRNDAVTEKAESVGASLLANGSPAVSESGGFASNNDGVPLAPARSKRGRIPFAVRPPGRQ